MLSIVSSTEYRAEGLEYQAGEWGCRVLELERQAEGLEHRAQGWGHQAGEWGCRVLEPERQAEGLEYRAQGLVEALGWELESAWE